MIDEAKRHHYCPDEVGTWCEYKAGSPSSKPKAHYLNPCFEKLLLPIYQYYTSKQMLLRLVAGMSTNNLENTNSVLWSILGKSKYHGTRKTEIAVMMCITRMEEGRVGIGALSEHLGLSLSSASKEQLAKVDLRREKLKAKRVTAGKDRYYRLLKEAIQNRESDSSYAPGVCDAGDGPSADMSFSTSRPLAINEEMNAPEDEQEISTSIAENCFVVIPFRPPLGWFAARVVDVDLQMKRVKLDWLYTSNQCNLPHSDHLWHFIIEC